MLTRKFAAAVSATNVLECVGATQLVHYKQRWNDLVEDAVEWPAASR